MSNVVRWDPFTDLRLTMDRFFDDSLTRPRRRLVSAREFAAMVPVEVSETDAAIDVKASLPGVKPEEVEITVHDDVLTIKAEHREEKTEGTPSGDSATTEGETTAEKPARRFYRRELRYGSFHRSFTLPTGVDADRAEAKFENGVLHLTLPKAEANRPKQIKVGGTTQG
ncbi:MAG: Hsp20/alpha crystallin family protein [Dehalococcoidia bacterium]